MGKKPVLLQTVHPTCQLFLAVLIGFTVLNLCRVYFSEQYFDLLEAEQDSIDLKTTFLRPEPSEIFQTWNSCIQDHLSWIEDPEIFWNDFQRASQKCDRRAHIEKLGIVTLRKYEKAKHVIFPKIYDSEPHNLFSIGIGRDIQAEKHFKRKMQKLGHGVSFYGVDPNFREKEKIYSMIGDFFPARLGMNPRISMEETSMKGGTTQKLNIINLDIVYYFKHLIKTPKVDNLWFDGEGSEFDPGFFNIFYRDGLFDENGIEVCQINLEIHRNPYSLDRMTRFMEFMKKIFEEKRYGVFHGDQFVNHRIYMFNFESSYCLKKFLNKV